MIAMGTIGQALTIKITDTAPDYGPKTKDPCGRGDAKDKCSCTGYVKTDSAKSNSADIFQKGFKAWNDVQPNDKKWTLKDGGDLEGTIEVSLFRTYNNCPGTAGAELRAYFKPKVDTGVWWRWSQALHDNYTVKLDHNKTAPAAFYEMDVKTGADELPPLYPYSYADGRYYDKPGAFCMDDQTVFFHAVTLISKADFTKRELTTYRGFEWGWDLKCVSAVPEPASMAAIGIGMIGLIRVRRSKSKGR